MFQGLLTDFKRKKCCSSFLSAVLTFNKLELAEDKRTFLASFFCGSCLETQLTQSVIWQDLNSLHQHVMCLLLEMCALFRRNQFLQCWLVNLQAYSHARKKFKQAVDVFTVKVKACFTTGLSPDLTL